MRSTLFDKGEEVHLWHISLDQNDDILSSDVLSEDEKARVSRFKRTSDADRYVRARSYLRHILGRYLDCQPGAVQFQYQKYGKPSISDHPIEPALSFNLSHTQDQIVIACACGREVGVDVEKISELQDSAGSAKLFMSGYEYAHWSRQGQAIDQFYRYWVCKEAYFKGLGMGLCSSNLQNTAFNLDQSWHLISPAPSHHQVWSVGEISLVEGCACAIALQEVVTQDRRSLRRGDAAIYFCRADEERSLDRLSVLKL